MPPNPLPVPELTPVAVPAMVCHVVRARFNRANLLAALFGVKDRSRNVNRLGVHRALVYLMLAQNRDNEVQQGAAHRESHPETQAEREVFKCFLHTLS